MGWLSRRRQKTVAIGTQMAAAVSAEMRHHVGLSYELAAGEYDLYRFVESATDDLVAAAALAAVQLRGQELVDVRDALSAGQGRRLSHHVSESLVQ